MANLPWWLPFGKVPEISAQALSERLAAGEPLQLVDVRTGAEWKGGHIAGAMHVPIGQLRGQLETTSFDRARTVIAICRSGHRSIPAVRLLQRFGHRDAMQLQGGMLAWRAAELPVEVE